MSNSPSTIQGNGVPQAGFGWDDSAELHKCADGGGLFHRLKVIRRGTVAELVAFVMTLPEQAQQDYAIQKAGDHTLYIGEIRALSRRSDYPRHAI